MNFSHMGPSYGLQLFPNCPSVGPSHGLLSSWQQSAPAWAALRVPALFRCSPCSGAGSSTGCTWASAAPVTSVGSTVTDGRGLGQRVSDLKLEGLLEASHSGRPCSPSPATKIPIPKQTLQNFEECCRYLTTVEK